MHHRIIAALMFAFAWLPATADNAGQRQLAGWGLDMRAPEPFMARAAATGFDVLITSVTDPARLEKAIAAGQRHGMRVFVCINPTGLARRLWTRHAPDEPVPWQVMTGPQEAALSFINAGDNKYLISPWIKPPWTRSGRTCSQTTSIEMPVKGLGLQRPVVLFQPRLPFAGIEKKITSGQRL